MSTRTIGFPDPETNPDHGAWTWDGEKWAAVGGGNGGGGESYDDTQIKADLATETQARADGDTGLQDQIDDLSDGGGDLPEMTNEMTPNTLVLRDGNASTKLTQLTVKNITLSLPTISNNTADTWFLSGGETSTHGVRKNDAEGMRASLNVYSKEESDALGGGGGAVDSVNGQTGEVILNAADVGALPSNYSAPVASVNGKTDEVILNAADVGALPSNYTPPAAPVDSVNGQTGEVILNAEDVGALPSNYSAPVASVNGKTDEVILNAADVGALPSNYSAPVTSVNGKTNEVILNAADVGALPSNYTPPAAPVTSVNGKTNAVTLSAADVGAQVAGSYAASNHNHSGVYADASHSHNYAASNHNHSGVYATASHTHSGYASSSHTHSGYLSSSGLTNQSGTLYGTDFVASSDERLKDNITVVPVGLIDGIKGREWDWKESGQKGSGVIAQELEQVFPHLVHTDDEGMKSVAYNGLVAYLIEELKDCRERISLLEAKK